MMTVLRLATGTLIVLGIVGAFATYPGGPTYLTLDQSRTVPIWIWCLLLSSAATAYLVALRYVTTIGPQVRAAAATTFVISLAAVLYSGDLARMWVQLVLKVI